jgi:hypothetical protein
MRPMHPLSFSSFFNQLTVTAVSSLLAERGGMGHGEDDKLGGAKRRGVWSVLSLVALVDPDTLNSDDDLCKGGPVKPEMTYPTPLAPSNIHAAVSRVTQ